MGEPPWKLAERAAFLVRQAEHCRRLLEIGAGTGQDAAFFAEHGLEVLATDLSLQMVARCRDKGLDARVLDFAELGGPAAGGASAAVPSGPVPAAAASSAALASAAGLAGRSDPPRCR
jgi:SAM-dependent methyltransferase